MTTEIKLCGLRWLCDDPIEIARVETLLTKEPGTIAWLNRELCAEDVFYDIGANIGLYSLYAASLFLPGPRRPDIYAFEPMPANLAALFRNVLKNQLVITPLALALTDHVGLMPFYCSSSRPGSSGHQLHADSVISPPGSCLVQGWTVDRLLREGLRPPTIIKIDVDGQEPAILRGMEKTLRRPELRALQVEVNPPHEPEIRSLLEPAGFRFRERHDTSLGMAKIAGGSDPALIPHNAVFERP